MALVLALAGMLFLAGGAAAQDRIPRLKMRLADTAVRPILIRQDEFYEHRISGQDTVRDVWSNRSFGMLYVEVTVDASGAVTDARPNPDYGDQSRVPPHLWGPAIAAARQWRFRPFERNGAMATVRGTLTLGILPAERLPVTHFALPDVPRTDVVIALRRRSEVRSYTVVIHGDGRVILTGLTLWRDRHEWTIPVERVDALIAQFRAADFWSLDPTYSDGPGTMDAETTTLAFGAGGVSRTVVDYAGLTVGMPDAVTQLENAIDEAADTARWTIGNSRTVAALRAEGFDFTSREAAKMLIGMIGEAPDEVVLELLDQGVNLDLDCGEAARVECQSGRTFRDGAIAWATIRKRPRLVDRFRSR